MKNMIIRKWLFISTLAISMALLTSCGSDGIGGTGAPINASIGINDDAIKASKGTISRIPAPFHDQGYSNFETKVISSQTELDQFISVVNGQNNWDNKPDFLKALQEEYDFSKNNLLLYRITELSDSIKLTPRDPVLENNKIIIVIDRQVTQQRKLKAKDYTPVYRTLGKTGIVNYILIYKVANTVKELVIKNGTEEKTVEFTSNTSGDTTSGTTEAKGITRIKVPFREHGYSNFKTTVITSQSDFNQFIDKVKEQDNWNNKNEFITRIQTETYDFTQYNLLLTRVTEASGSIQLTPQNPQLKDGKIHIVIDKKTPQAGTGDIANYLLVYKVKNTIQEVVIINGTDKESIKLVDTAIPTTPTPLPDNKTLVLSASEKKSLFKLFGLNATTSNGVGIRVIDKDGSGNISEGDTAILARGGASQVSQQFRTLSAADIASIYNSAGNTGENGNNSTPKGKLVRSDESKLSTYFHEAITQRTTKTEAIAIGGVPVLAADSNFSAASSSSNTGVSSTNIQEKGVDEADLIKTNSDGHYIFSVKKPNPNIYALPAGAVFRDEALDIKTSIVAPAPATATFSVSDSIRIMDTQKTDGLAEVKQITTSNKKEPWNISGLYLHEATNRLVALSSKHNNYWDHWFEGNYFANQKTDLFLIDINDPKKAAVKTTLHFDGQLIDSRRNGDTLYMVLRHYPNYQYIDKEKLTVTTAEDFLPKYTIGSNANKQLISQPKDCYQEEGKKGSADIITLIAIDLNSNTTSPTINSQCYVGSAEAIYASQNALYLATTKWDYQVSNGFAKYGNPQITTDIHKFAYKGLSFEYKGSGEVKGHLGYKQDSKSFRFSEHEGKLRVVTFDEQMWFTKSPEPLIQIDPSPEGDIADIKDPETIKKPTDKPLGTTPTTPIRARSKELNERSPVSITILKENSDKTTLEVIAKLPNAKRPEAIGKPGERLYATRFIGNRGFVVTFRVTDPLYVLDLSDPEDPYIAGELKVDGYSDYLHPITDTLLLGVGKDAIPDKANQFGDGRGAWYQGVKLSLIDISNPASPREADKIIIGKRGTQSAALNNHHALTGLKVGDNYRLAIPVQVHDNKPQYNPDGVSTPSTFYSYTHTGLYRFEIDIDQQHILQKDGMLVDQNNKKRNWNPQFENDRSIFINDNVYFMHDGEFWTQDWSGETPLIGPK